MRVQALVVRTLMAVGVAAVAAGCHNPCQDVCVEMKKYAEECGFEISNDDLKACFESQRKPDDVTKAFCVEFGDPETIRVEWASCDELAIYWDAATGTTTADSGQ